jgi:hypothetical protein
MSEKRGLEELVQRCTWRMDKARKIAMEATAMADQLEGDLYMAKQTLEALNGNGATTKKGAPAKKEDDAEDEFDRELAIEQQLNEEASGAEEDALNALPTDAEGEAEALPERDGQLSGFPDDGTPENATFEALLKAGTLKLKLVDRPDHAPDQAIEPGPNGRRSDVFDHKDLFKKCSPRFFFNGEAKEWRRAAPAGWQQRQLPTAVAPAWLRVAAA